MVEIMDTLQLKLFISVSQTRNFTKTANEFYMSQPTVSNYIKALENAVGVKLLNRDSRSVVLTPEGEEFIDYAHKILTLELEAENRLKNISKGRRGYIRIAMLSSSVELFSKCLMDFSKYHKDVQVDVDILEGAEMMKVISQGSYDIYFANSYMIPGSDNIEYLVTGVERLHLFAHKDIARKIDMDNWSSLAHWHFVSVPETDFALSIQIKNICESRGVVPDIINYYNHADTLLLAVNSKIGIAILPPSLKYLYNFPDIIALPIDGDEAVIRPIVAWEKGKNNEHAQRFISLCSPRRA